MTRADALDLLELEPAATSAEIRRAYERQYNACTTMISDATSPEIRAKGEDALRRLEQAYVALLERTSPRAEYEDIPWSERNPDGSPSGSGQTGGRPNGPGNPPPRPEGMLLVRASEPCVLRIDGEPAGALDGHAPLRLPLLPGAHWLEAETADGRRWEAEVNVEAGRQALARVELPARTAGDPLDESVIVDEVPPGESTPGPGARVDGEAPGPQPGAGGGAAVPGSARRSGTAPRRDRGRRLLVGAAAVAVVGGGVAYAAGLGGRGDAPAAATDSLVMHVDGAAAADSGAAPALRLIDAPAAGAGAEARIGASDRTPSTARADTSVARRQPDASPTTAMVPNTGTRTAAVNATPGRTTKTTPTTAPTTTPKTTPKINPTIVPTLSTAPARSTAGSTTSTSVPPTSTSDQLLTGGKSSSATSANGATTTPRRSAAELYDEAMALWRNLKINDGAARMREAAETGDLRAGAAYGMMLRTGWSDDERRQEGHRWLVRTAERGYADAQLILWRGYRGGEFGYAVDKPEAVRWLKRAADGGNAGAMHWMGHAFRDGEGVSVDVDVANRWFRQASDRGDGAAMRDVALAYLGGQGYPKNAEEGIRWMRRSAEKGEVRSMVLLAGYHRRGEHTAIDLGEALRWYRQAAAKQDADAMYALGGMYENGEGTAANRSEAISWYERAAEKGSRAASAALKRLGASG